MESTLVICARVTQRPKLLSMPQPRGPTRRDRCEPTTAAAGPAAPAPVLGLLGLLGADSIVRSSSPGAVHSTQEDSGMRGTAGAGCRHITPAVVPRVASRGCHGLCILLQHAHIQAARAFLCPESSAALSGKVSGGNGALAG